MKKKKIQIRKYAITVWLAAAMIVTGTIAVKAAYTSTKSVKRVISIRDSETLFSSNYLSVSGGIKTRMFHINEDETGGYVSVPVNVCNYAQGDKTEFNSQDITYDISFKLVDVNGKQLSDSVFGEDNPLDNYGVILGDNTVKKFDSSDSEIILNSRVLSSAYADSHKYTLTFDLSQIKNQVVYIKAEATPSSDVLYVQPLKGVIGVAYQSNVSKGGWSGRFTDDEKKEFSSYDAFNYEISGSGSGKVTVSWNKDELIINPFFTSELISEYEESDDSITFDVDSSEKSRYTVQFYKTTNSSEKIQTWDKLKSSVLFTYAENK